MPHSIGVPRPFVPSGGAALGVNDLHLNNRLWRLHQPVNRRICGKFLITRRNVKWFLGAIVIGVIWMVMVYRKVERFEDGYRTNFDGSQTAVLRGRTKIESVDGIEALAKRRVPLEDLGRIRFELIQTNGTEDEWYKWEVSAEGNSVRIEATSLSSLSLGLGQFYRVYCSMELLSWADASRPSRSCLDGSSTSTQRSFQARARFPLRYGWNAVTFSYTTTWWRWERYEQELDWLALRGVNLLLAHEGQEFIMRKVFRELIHASLDPAFFTHQTYFAWNRMGNIHHLGHPADDEYIAQRYKLQRQILKRMQELGIAPVLPGFNGYIPKGTPGAKCFLKYWSGFSAQTSSVCRLLPSIPLFSQITRKMVEVQLKEYGEFLADKKVLYFSSDTYNENPVHDGEEDQFKELATAVYSPALQAAKQFGFHLKLVMQMWFLANDFDYWTPDKATEFLEAFPKNSLVLLDLHAEKRAQFERLDLDADWFKRTGHALIFCVLHNFGGGGGIAGEVLATWREMAESSDVESVLRASEGGIGFAPEALEQNEFVYDMALASAWSGHSTLREVVSTWIRSRYRVSVVPPEIKQAWSMVIAKAYSRPEELGGFGPHKSVWEIRPLPGLMIRRKFMPTVYAYPPDTFLNPVTQMGAVARKGLNAPALLHDLVDFARQLLADAALELVRRLQRSNFNDEADVFENAKRDMQRLLNLVGELLSSHSNFCFLDEPPGYIPLNAKARSLRRQLITLWNEENDGSLADYGSRQLGGSLFFQVHRKRWLMALDAYNAPSFQLDKSFRDMEVEWSKDNKDDPIQYCRFVQSPNELLRIVDKIINFVEHLEKG